MTARHVLPNQSVRVDWRAIGSMLGDIHEVVWKFVTAAFWALLGLSVFALLGWSFAQDGQWAAGAMAVVGGTALIVYALIMWLGRQTMEHQRPGQQTCPWCARDGVRLTVEVIGHPRPDITTLVDAKGIKVCGSCAPTVIFQALDEHQFSSWPVEVLPIKQVA